ncbi:paired amphipathic helix protein Sin3-like 2 [Corylus avellana]|uniref:paired amphipathic helix protein Sin3-like 2 n=1 Tax=Corylus avellana TaxID=13451 RepID=UPI00286B9B5C|nr:paired amphipathic helix protein Sin3-like 2 [Corylus avellana]
MKRFGDDVYTDSSQFKRPFGSSGGRGGSDGQSHIPGGEGGGGGGTSLKLTTFDALNYLKKVKAEFRYQREKYDVFLKLMRDFKAQMVGTHHVIATVKKLFKGHNNLISGFNTFIPKGYEIILEDDDKAPPPNQTAESEEAITFENKIKADLEEAISFEKKIKERFQNDVPVYKAFLDILDSYRKEHKGINEIYSEVTILFDGHPDLLDKFKSFIPESAHNAPHLQDSFQPLNEQSQMHMDKARIIPSNADRDLSVDHPELEDEKSKGENAQ